MLQAGGGQMEHQQKQAQLQQQELLAKQRQSQPLMKVTMQGLQIAREATVLQQKGQK